MHAPINRKLTLEKLENSIWPNSDFDSHLVKRCHELRKIPLENFTIEDLRILIGQQIGLNFLIEIAIEKLSENVLAEGDFYPGDLLNSVIGIDKKYWAENWEQRILLAAIINNNLDKLNEHPDLSIKAFL